jgi:hypothetical protein
MHSWIADMRETVEEPGIKLAQVFGGKLSGLRERGTRWKYKDLA